LRQPAEGGCGVVGFLASEPVAGRHLEAAARQMNNRGNGKGGGIVAAGLDPAQLGVSPEVLRSHYLVQVAYLDPECREEVEDRHVLGPFAVARSERVPAIDDWHDVPGLEVPPPEVWRYFCRPREEQLAAFVAERGFADLDRRSQEDAFVHANSFALNTAYYTDRPDPQAFVLCHGRDLLVFKIVGFAEQVITNYRLGDLHARLWIAHQRYPTKGRVWHPGGAHPFIGLNEALVHNGDFANYQSVRDYLGQHGMTPLFLTDTEVSVQLFDLLDRVYGYPLEYIIEALAPTTERDFLMLPEGKQEVYAAIQRTHIHGSPDGPWFFIIGRAKPDRGLLQLVGITDTSMLRPQVFALQRGELDIGLVASEKQAIDAVLENIHGERSGVPTRADLYWNARGGSHTDGGAFAFSLEDGLLVCRDKYGGEVDCPRATPSSRNGSIPSADTVMAHLARNGVESAFLWLRPLLAGATSDGLRGLLSGLAASAHDTEGPGPRTVLGLLTLLLDRGVDTPHVSPGWRRTLIESAINDLLLRTMVLPGPDVGGLHRHAGTGPVPSPPGSGATLVVRGRGYPMEGPDSLSRSIVDAYRAGWRHIIAFDLCGQRFVGCGLLGQEEPVIIDVYGSPGDYLGSGLMNGEVRVHADGQDQLGQILAAGRLVVHGDVGQTFLYGAKGGEVYVRGNAAGRPLINAVGGPRVVINGTCLDYLAESFMAGDPLAGGGFAVLNGVAALPDGTLHELDTPFSGGNLFSLASGGALYIRDPRSQLDEGQLNGGVFTELSADDWELIRPYLEENERLFGIALRELLTVDGRLCPPQAVYRKVVPRVEVLA